MSYHKRCRAWDTNRGKQTEKEKTIGRRHTSTSPPLQNATVLNQSQRQIYLKLISVLSWWIYYLSRHKSTGVTLYTPTAYEWANWWRDMKCVSTHTWTCYIWYVCLCVNMHIKWQRDFAIRLPSELKNTVLQLNRHQKTPYLNWK